MTHHKHELHSHKVSNKISLVAKEHVTEITEEQREHMVAEAAYYLAEHRGFQGGNPTQDWLQAQFEIDRKTKIISH